MTRDRFSQSARQLSSDPQPRMAALSLAQRYSYVLPDARALAMIADLSPLAEIGAGTGYGHTSSGPGEPTSSPSTRPPPGRRACALAWPKSGQVCWR
jgi:hypothetical protein